MKDRAVETSQYRNILRNQQSLGVMWVLQQQR